MKCRRCLKSLPDVRDHLQEAQELADKTRSRSEKLLILSTAVHTAIMFADGVCWNCERKAA